MNNKENLISSWIKSGLVRDYNLIKAFKEIKRENFVLPEYRESAYEDIALPIGKDSTISQPSTIMIMLQALELKPHLKVLEVGTGSGYTASIMSKIVGEKENIYSIDIAPELIDFAKNNLEKENIKNVKLFCRDGSKGLKEYSPFDRILMNTACKEIPKELIKQLKINGILIAPIGSEYSQKMIKFTKGKNKLKEEYLGDFVFVKLKEE